MAKELKGYFKLFVLVLVVTVSAAEGDSCPMKSNDCTCTFTEADDGGEGLISKTMTTTEILAGAAGAMAPMLIGGSILGIYKLKTGGKAKDFDRSDSRMSDGNGSLPPGYSSRRGSRGDGWMR